MKKIITHGYSKYEIQCKQCMCTFEYELEDINDGKVICPDCGCECSHSYMNHKLTCQIKE